MKPQPIKHLRVLNILRIPANMERRRSDMFACMESRAVGESKRFQDFSFEGDYRTNIVCQTNKEQAA